MSDSYGTINVDMRNRRERAGEIVENIIEQATAGGRNDLLSETAGRAKGADLDPWKVREEVRRSLVNRVLVAQYPGTAVDHEVSTAVQPLKPEEYGNADKCREVVETEYERAIAAMRQQKQKQAVSGNGHHAVMQSEPEGLRPGGKR